MARGSILTLNDGMTVARYVGEWAGVVWLCYDESGYDAMCRAFDRLTR